MITADFNFFKNLNAAVDFGISTNRKEIKRAVARLKEAVPQVSQYEAYKKCGEELCKIPHKIFLNANPFGINTDSWARQDQYLIPDLAHTSMAIVYKALKLIKAIRRLLGKTDNQSYGELEKVEARLYDLLEGYRQENRKSKKGTDSSKADKPLTLVV